MLSHRLANFTMRDRHNTITLTSLWVTHTALRRLHLDGAAGLKVVVRAVVREVGECSRSGT
jgi:hypothetical protein